LQFVEGVPHEVAGNGAAYVSAASLVLGAGFARAGNYRDAAIADDLQGTPSAP
jgi:hypothetical protein